jgi:hypothetical protein
MVSDKYKIMHEIEDLLGIQRLYGLYNVRTDHLILMRDKIKELDISAKKTNLTKSSRKDK